MNIQPNAEAINGVKPFPFLDPQVVLNGLKEGLPSYVAKVCDLDPDIDILLRWQCNESVLPCWTTAAGKTLLCSHHQ